jgi:cytochrome c oxidase cbb3-type subunit 1
VLSAVTHFSDYAMGEGVMLMFGFLSTLLFGSLYYVVPRLTGADFPQRHALWHFWLFVWGAGTMFLCLSMGGLVQGFALYDPGVEFMSSVTLAAPFRALYALGSLAVFGSTIVFAVLFTRNLFGETPPAVTPRVSSQTPEVVSV